jgi:hypothetical protein
MPHYLAAVVLPRIADEGARVSLVLLALERTGSGGHQFNDQVALL